MALFHSTYHNVFCQHLNSLPKRRVIQKRPDNLFPYDEAKECFTTSEGIPIRTLYVSKLTASIREDDLFHCFSKFGRVENVAIVKKFAQNARNQFLYAFLTYSSSKDCAKALKARYRFYVRGQQIFYNPADTWHQPKDSSEQQEFDEELEVEDAQDPDQCPISILNDDCLRLIFDLIPGQQRLKLGLVCKRWRRLNQLYWEGLSSLDFTVSPFSEVKLTHNKLDSILNLCPNLTKLKVRQQNKDSTSNFLVSIGKHCKLLQELTLIEVILHRRCLAHLAQSCPDLREIYFSSVPTLVDHELVFLLKKCSRLETLKIELQKNLTGRWLNFLRAPLKTLYLSFFDCDDDKCYNGLANVKETLTSLSIVYCQSFSSAQLRFITEQLRNLEHLSLRGSLSPVFNDALMTITNLKKLKSLDLSYARIEPKFISQLAEQCPDLESLDITSVHLSCMGKTLVELTSLKTLKLNKLRSFTDDVLISLSKKLKSLEDISLVHCTNLTDTGVIALIKNCPLITKLDITGCRLVTSKTVMTIMDFFTDKKRQRITIAARSSGVKKEEWSDDPNLGNFIHLDFKNNPPFSLADSIWSDTDSLDDDYDDEDFEGSFEDSLSDIDWHHRLGMELLFEDINIEHVDDFYNYLDFEHQLDSDFSDEDPLGFFYLN